MTYQVQLKSGEYSFSAEAHESILNAAIRVGVPLDYGCSNGNCGLCKARVIHGETKLLRNHDFVIREAEKFQGYALMCSIACQSDVVIDAEVAEDVTAIPVQDLRVKVRKIDQIGDELAIVTTQVSRAERLRFLAGQYMKVCDDQGCSHDYAIASCPCDEKRLEFHVRKLRDDAFSNMVFASLNIGDWLDIHGPYGDFVIHEARDNPLVMIAFDTGFATIKSLLEHVTAQDSERVIFLYWLACGDEGLYLDNLCRSWDDALDQMSYLPIRLSRRANEIIDSQYEGMSMIEEKLSQSLHHVDSLKDADIYTVAPEPVAKLVRQLLIHRGFQSQQIYHEPIRGNPNLKCIHPTVTA